MDSVAKATTTNIPEFFAVRSGALDFQRIIYSKKNFGGVDILFIDVTH
jgi:hypothetical protein